MTSPKSCRPGDAAKRAAFAASLALLLVGCTLGHLSAAPSEGPSPVVAAADASRLRTFDCTTGRETASSPLPPSTSAARVAPAARGDAIFVAAGGQLLRLQLPSLATTARAVLPFPATSLAVSGGADGIVLAGGRGENALSALEPTTLASLHEYRLDDDRRATVSSVVDRAQRSRFVVAFSDLDEIWEIDYRHDAPPVLRGLVHDYRMREAVELPGRFTPRPFKVEGATRALVAGSVANEMLRIDASGAIGVLNLDVRREIERPAAGTVPDPARIAAWRGARSRGWVLAEGATLRVLDAAAWSFVEPIDANAPVLAVFALDDGAVLLALDRGARIVLARVDVETHHAQVLAGATSAGRAPYRFVRGTRGCIALLDAGNRWIAGLGRRE